MNSLATANLIQMTGSAGSPALPSLGTIIYDDQFTTDRASLPNGTNYAADVGTSLFRNARSGDLISGGKLQFDSSTILIFGDSEAKNSPRSRLAGRIHYSKATTTDQVYDCSGWLAAGIAGSSSSANWWANATHDTGMLYHGSGRIRDNRWYLPNYTSSGENTGNNRGNYQTGQWFESDGGSAGDGIYEVETALVERGTAGTMAFNRLDGGAWRLVWLESLSNATGALNCQVIATSGVDYYSRIMTANSAFSAPALVQHSFATLGNSDGLGQTESGGSGIVAESGGTGTAAIASSKLTSSATGTVIQCYDTGSTDWVAHCKQTIYDGSPCGPVIRWVDSSNYMYAQLDSTANNLKLIEVVSGSATTLQTIALSPGTTDNWDVTDGLDIYWTWKSQGGNYLSVTVAPGSSHDSFLDSTSTRFSSATKCGVMVSKGASVNSSTAEDLVVFAGTQLLPDFS